MLTFLRHDVLDDVQVPPRDLRAHWALVTADLRRASNSVGGLSEALAREFAEFLAHNELELAHDVLMKGASSNASPYFWQHLARAAERMGITGVYSTAHSPAVWAGRMQAIVRRTMEETAPHLQPEAQEVVGEGSIAAAEIATTTERGPSGPWSARIFQTAYVPAHMSSLMILEICVAMDLLLDLPVLACWPHEILARSAIEATGVVDWLMESGIAPRQRVVRYILLTWAGAKAQERTLTEMGLADEGPRYGSTPDSVRAECANLGINEPTGKGYGPVLFECEGQSLPGFTSRAKNSLGARPEAATYSLYSLIAHSQITGLLRGFTLSTIHGKSFLAVNPDLHATWAATRIACASLLKAVHRLAEVYGWNIDALEVWIDEFDRRAAQIESALQGHPLNGAKTEQ